MKRLYSNGALSFYTHYQNKDICLYKIDIKEPFEYETDKIDGHIIDTIIKNDKDETALYFISNENHLIALQTVVVGNQEVTYPVIIFDEQKYKPAYQEDHLIFITSSHNLLSDYPLIKECTNEIEWQFLNRLNTCEIYPNSDFSKTQYHNSRLSLIDGQPNCFHFNTDFDEIYANYREEDYRVSRWAYNIGKKNEYLITQCDDTGESFIYYTNPIERFKYNLMRPKTLAILGALALVATGAIKCSSHNDEKEIPHSKPELIQSAETPTINQSSSKTR